MILKREIDGVIKAVRISNLTPHTVTINGVTIEPEGTPARLKTTRERTGDICGIPIFKTELGAVENLPEKATSTILIVSRMVKDACPGRDDLFSPSGLIRDEGGNIIGCEGLE